jgi:hypothetical protein
MMKMKFQILVFFLTITSNFILTLPIEKYRK